MVQRKKSQKYFLQIFKKFYSGLFFHFWRPVEPKLWYTTYCLYFYRYLLHFYYTFKAFSTSVAPNIFQGATPKLPKSQFFQKNLKIFSSQWGRKMDFFSWPISGLNLSETCSNERIFDLSHWEVGEIKDFGKFLKNFWQHFSWPFWLF